MWPLRWALPVESGSPISIALTSAQCAAGTLAAAAAYCWAAGLPSTTMTPRRVVGSVLIGLFYALLAGLPPLPGRAQRGHRLGKEGQRLSPLRGCWRLDAVGLADECERFGQASLWAGDR